MPPLTARGDEWKFSVTGFEARDFMFVSQLSFPSHFFPQNKAPDLSGDWLVRSSGKGSGPPGLSSLFKAHSSLGSPLAQCPQLPGRGDLTVCTIVNKQQSLPSIVKSPVPCVDQGH